ncbi:MAG: TM0996/MTH895 family glutaredoxin-like protein [Fidelibacterota bacterium]|nr:MAG: TM0996/MTH895 family glutaredoxin-like protein [Candidatus Neomarinimicrobiota bacterium]
MTTAKILGIGCPRCDALEARVRSIAQKHNLDVEVIKVTDIDEMIRYGIMMTPGLVVEEEVKSSGIIPKEDELLEWLGERRS